MLASVAQYVFVSYPQENFNMVDPFYAWLYIELLVGLSLFVSIFSFLLVRAFCKQKIEIYMDAL
jgi:hypothetical protein